MVETTGRAAHAGAKAGNHSFRATGITAYLKNGGTRTTQLYDKGHDAINFEVERIRV